jgi:hypothetical protein
MLGLVAWTGFVRILAAGALVAVCVAGCSSNKGGSSQGPGKPTAAEVAQARRLLDPQNTGLTTQQQDTCVAEAVVQNPDMDELANDMAQIQNGDLRQAVMSAYLVCAYNFVLDIYMRFAPTSFTAAEKACLRDQFTQLDVGTLAEIIVQDPDAQYVGPAVIHACLSHSGVDPLKHIQIPSTPAASALDAKLVAETEGATTEAKSAAIDVSWSWLPGSPSKPAPYQPVHATGFEDFQHKSADFTFSGTGMKLGGAPLELVSESAKAYVDGSALGHGSGSFVAAPPTLPSAGTTAPSAGGNASGGPPVHAAMIESYLPSQLLTLLASVSGLTPIGAMTIGGVGTSGYSGSLQGGFEAPFAELFGPTISGGSGGSSTPSGNVEVWFDSQHRLVRFQTSIELTPADSGLPDDATLNIQETLSHFGTAIDIPRGG